MSKFKKGIKTVCRKLKCAVKEVLNLLTNFLCPVMSALCVFAEALQFPTGVIKVLKKIEYWFWKVGGTKENIENFVDKIDEAAQNIEDEEEGE